MPALPLGYGCTPCVARGDQIGGVRTNPGSAAPARVVAPPKNPSADMVDFRAALQKWAVAGCCCFSSCHLGYSLAVASVFGVPFAGLVMAAPPVVDVLLVEKFIRCDATTRLPEKPTHEVARLTLPDGSARASGGDGQCAVETVAGQRPNCPYFAAPMAHPLSISARCIRKRDTSHTTPGSRPLRHVGTCF